MNCKRILILTLTICLTFFAKVSAESDDVVQRLKETYDLQRHEEGGYFAEVYTSPFRQRRHRATAGSIYFLLDKEDVSHFHQLDCDEIWCYHAGCGMKITVLNDGRIEEFFLGVDAENSRATVVISAGAIFAAENIDKTSYTLVSCVTTPQFRYRGFRLITRDELKKIYPNINDELLRLAYEKV